MCLSMNSLCCTGDQTGCSTVSKTFKYSDSKYFYVFFIMLGGRGLTGGGQKLKIKLSASTLCSAYIIT